MISVKLAAVGAAWTATTASVAVDAIHVLSIPRSAVILAAAACVSLTVWAGAGRIVRAVERESEKLSAAITSLDEKAIAPVREAFVHGIQVGQAGSADGSNVVLIPRQIYTAAGPPPALNPTADGATATTIELPRVRDDQRPRPRRGSRRAGSGRTPFQPPR